MYGGGERKECKERVGEGIKRRGAHTKESFKKQQFVTTSPFTLFKNGKIVSNRDHNICIIEKM